MVTPSSKQVIAAFDFDGTITTKDTFLPFLVKAFGLFRVSLTLISLILPGIMVCLGKSTRDRFKALLIGKLFPGISIEYLEEIGVQHALQITSLFRPAALKRILWHKQNGHRLIMVSASLNFYLEPISKQLEFDDLLCTKVASTEGVCTGEMNGENCRAIQKVKRLEELVGPLNEYEVYAYGDSDGDAEMLAISNYPAFMPFH